MDETMDSDARPAKRQRLENEPLPDAQLEREHRYTDFIVNEVQPDGQVLHLSSLDVPKASAQDQKQRQRNKGDDVPNEQATTLVEGDENIEKPDKDSLHKLLNEWNSVWPHEASTFARSESQEHGNTVRGILGPEAYERASEVSNLFGAAVTEEIIRLYIQHLAGDSPAPFTTPPMSDRAQRTSAHQLIRRVFSSNLDTVTSDDGSIVVTAVRSRSAGRAPKSQRQRTSRDVQGHAPKQQDEYLHFTLYKENRDTAEVKSFLCKQLRLNPKRFEYAGTKDRRAVTAQRCSLYRMNVHQLHAVGKRLRGTAIGDFEYQSYGLRLGQTGGNEFVITLRDAHTANDELLSLPERRERLQDAAKRAAQSLLTNGFLNYFGLQRFGSFDVATSTVGTKILQNDLRGAVDAILFFAPSALPPPAASSDEPSSDTNNVNASNDPAKVSDDDTLRAQAINHWRQTSDAKAAVAQMPRRFIAETLLMEHLSSKNGDRRNDFQGALMTLPRQTRTLYLHAYQSLVWNKMASTRWKTYGSRVVEGDVILDASSSTADAEMANTFDDQGEIIVHPSSPIEKSSYRGARLVTASDIASNRFTIRDVVLPLPGHDVLYPSHTIGQEYKTFMASAEGGGLDPHDMKRSWRDASLTGEYRNLVNYIDNVEASVKSYIGEEQLVQTDLEKIQGQKRREKGQEVVVGDVAVSEEVENVSVRKEKDNEVNEVEKGTDNDTTTENEMQTGEVKGSGQMTGVTPTAVDTAQDLGRKVANTVADTVIDSAGRDPSQDMSQDLSEEKPQENAQLLAVLLKFRLGPGSFATMALRELMGEGMCREYKPDLGGRK
ncbi:MAG: hypothetical protein Q9162_002776 [Coniocarpon cinnabarinum]